MPAPTPVTILTGFLGSGKTTLLNHILRQPHGHKIAVIENEFGEAGVDGALLIQDHTEQIVVMNNCCICCTVRGDLVRILDDLAERKRSGELQFDRVLIETTGLADPAPVAQTFLLDEPIKARFALDGVVTMVDAKHGAGQLDQHSEAQAQVGFADRLLISKSDLVGSADLAALRDRLRTINPRAPQKVVEHGNADVADVLDINGFDVGAILELAPDFLVERHAAHHDHDDHIGSFVFRSRTPFDRLKLEHFMAVLVQEFGKDLLRYKGVASFEGDPNHVVFQGVQKELTASVDRRWGAMEERESVLVFIGRDLPKERMAEALNLCLVTETAPSPVA